MNSFYNKFRNKILNQTPPDFNEGDWQLLEKKLNAQDNKKHSFGILPWLLFLCIPILGGWSLYNWNQSIDLRQSRLASLSQPDETITTITEIHDTLYITEYINIPHLVYVDKPTNINQASPLEFVANTSISQIENPKQTSIKNDQETIISNTLEHQTLNKPTTDIKKENEHKSTTNNPMVQTTNDIPVVAESSLPEIPIEVSLPLAAEKNSLLRQIKKNITPAKVFVGLEMGYPYVTSKGLENKWAFIAGINSTLAFPNSLELYISANYVNLYYESRFIGGEFGIPEVKPPTAEFQLTKAEIRKPSYTISSIVSCPLLKHTFLKPTLGLGIGYRYSDPTAIVYEFDHPNLQIEWLFEDSFKAIQPHAFYWIISSNVDYSLSTRWTLGMQASLNKSFNTLKNELPDYLKLQLGLKYRINH